MKKIDTSKRTDASEIMDDFDLQGQELRKTLNDLENINNWLGGNKITIQGISELLKKSNSVETITIADVGCGNGAMLRKIADWGRKNNYNLELMGIDANAHAIGIARELSKTYSEINFLEANIFSEAFKKLNYDIILCTLTLHHFKDAEINQIIDQFYGQSNKGIVINDLQRSRTAYVLFKAFCSVFVRNEIARKDGLISILRGFKKPEIESFSQKIPSRQQQISWKWAFRYQWIIEKELKNL